MRNYCVYPLKFKVYKEDERISVFYDPENPENARIGDWRNLFGLEIIFFIFGVGLFYVRFSLIKKKA